MPTILEKVTLLLNSYGVKYSRFEHEPVVTSLDAARVRKSDLSQGAKALVFMVDKKPALIVIPGDKKVDTGRFKRLFGVKDIYMADAQKLMEVTGLEKGAVPPIGKVFNIPAYFDESFKQKDIAAFNAGSHSVSVEMRAEDLIKVAEPVFGDFSKD